MNSQLVLLSWHPRGIPCRQCRLTSLGLAACQSRGARLLCAAGRQAAVHREFSGIPCVIVVEQQAVHRERTIVRIEDEDSFIDVCALQNDGHLGKLSVIQRQETKSVSKSQKIGTRRMSGTIPQ